MGGGVADVMVVEGEEVEGVVVIAPLPPQLRSSQHFCSPL